MAYFTHLRVHSWINAREKINISFLVQTHSLSFPFTRPYNTLWSQLCFSKSLSQLGCAQPSSSTCMHPLILDLLSCQSGWRVQTRPRRSVFWILNSAATDWATMARANRRAKLPKTIRRRIQHWVRNFVYAVLTWITFWSCYVTVTEFHKFGDVMKIYGFNPGRRL